ncbi:type II toxin-antitoxin system RelE family toxin [Halonotius sp. GCM10025705]|uniref:type II toxin-antitoxin system RelE family toxin n=1 Tax=Halonotius sp. GCM10025705 TaxID=3252678 RepID=UPI00361B8A0A
MAPTTSDDGWEWELSPQAESQLAALQSDTQQQIIDKLDEVVSSEWREPAEFLESLTNSPFQKLRVGGYRLGCRIRQETQVVRVESIRKREGAYKGDD